MMELNYKSFFSPSFVLTSGFAIDETSRYLYVIGYNIQISNITNSEDDELDIGELQVPAFGTMYKVSIDSQEVSILLENIDPCTSMAVDQNLHLIYYLQGMAVSSIEIITDQGVNLASIPLSGSSCLNGLLTINRDTGILFSSSNEIGIQWYNYMGNERGLILSDEGNFISFFVDEFGKYLFYLDSSLFYSINVTDLNNLQYTLSTSTNQPVVETILVGSVSSATSIYIYPCAKNDISCSWNGTDAGINVLSSLLIIIPAVVGILLCFALTRIFRRPLPLNFIVDNEDPTNINPLYKK